MQVDSITLDPLFELFAAQASEETVLRGMLTDRDMLARTASAGITAAVFTGEAEQIARILLAQFRTGGAADASTVQAALEEKRSPAADSPLLEYAASPSPAAFRFHLERLLMLVHLRGLEASMFQVREEVFRRDDAGLAERIGRMERGLSRLAAGLYNRADQTYDATALARLATEPLPLTPSGLDRLDALTGGYMPGRVTLIAARPSHGKTSLALELSRRRCRVEPEKRVLYFSAEMSAHAVARRIKSALSVGEGFPDIIVDPEARPTTAHMLGRSLALHAERPLSMIVFDYLQYTGEEARDRRLSMDQALRGCHEIAKRLGVPFLVLAQLNRNIEHRGEGAEPQLADIKETGGAEEVSALVLMPHHPHTAWYQQGRSGPEPNREHFKLYARKNTHGPLGSVTLSFDREAGRFDDNYAPQGEGMSSVLRRVDLQTTYETTDAPF